MNRDRRFRKSLKYGLRILRNEAYFAAYTGITKGSRNTDFGVLQNRNIPPFSALLSREKREMDLAQTLASHPVMLTEGAVIERLKRETGAALHPDILNTALLCDPSGRRADG